MKTTIIDGPSPGISETQLEHFEREIGFRFDKSYRDFLKMNNGGVSLLGYPFDGEVRELVFYELREDFTGLRSAYADLETFAYGYLPIARDNGEDQYLLGLPPNMATISIATKIYGLFDGIPVRVDLRQVATSFDDFISSLVPLPKNECQIIHLGEFGTKDDLRRFLELGNSISAIGANDMTVVCEATKFGNAELVKACVEHGASLVNAMKIAVINRNLAMVKLLLDSGANINERGDGGRTPLDYTSGLYPEALRVQLVELGAKNSAELQH